MNAGMTDDKFINMVNHARRSQLITTMVVVYKKPLDYPDSYVARLWFINKDYHYASETIYIVRDTLEDIHQAIPKDLVNFGRTKSDDPKIFEVYM